MVPSRRKRHHRGEPEILWRARTPSWLPRYPGDDFWKATAEDVEHEWQLILAWWARCCSALRLLFRGCLLDRSMLAEGDYVGGSTTGPAPPRPLLLLASMSIDHAPPSAPRPRTAGGRLAA